MCECVWYRDPSRKSNFHKFSYTKKNEKKNETKQNKASAEKKLSAVWVVAPPAWQSAS